MGDFAVGQPVTRTEDPRMLRGEGQFIDDTQYSNMAHACLVRSPHPHALIRSIDAAAALAAPGVRLVMTGADWAASGCADLPTATGPKHRPDGSPMYRPRYPALVADRVRFVGDPVAFVVADTQGQARDAADLVEVDYDPLPCVTDIALAQVPGATLVWDDCPNNVCMVHDEGDADAAAAAIASAAHIVRHRFTISRVTAASLEPRGAVGVYDRRTRRYTLHTPLQRPLPFRRELSDTLRVPEADLRVLAGDIGGSFGMKSALYNEAPLLLLASRRLGRPVKWISTRSEAFLSDAQGRDNVTDAELALDASGHFLALRVRTVAALGAYTQPGSDIGAWSNLGSLAGVYTTPVIHVRATPVYTNTNPIRPYRGNGRPEASYVIERMIDLAADQMSIDPAELRRRNMISEAAMPFQTALSFRYDCGAFEKLLDEALALVDYTGFPARRAEAAGRGRLRGIGMSCTIERAGLPGAEGAELRVDGSGGVTILTGCVPQGQGHETTFKQLVVSKFGVLPDQVRCKQGDTDQIAFGDGTYGSRTSSLGAAAISLAGDKVIAKAKAIAAHLLGSEEILFADGTFSSRTSNRTLTFGDVATAAALPNGLPAGMEAGLSASAGYRQSQQNYPNGTHVVEVEVDPDTGELTIERYVVADDVGTVLNPALVEGQILGGIAQGAGQILLEAIHFEPESGQNLTCSFMDYAMPRATLLPNVTVTSIPVPTATNPLGTKGAGEGGCVGAMPALANAIVDALSPLGILHIDMPATSERIWRAIQDARR